ncbi:hypothetical protein G7Z17_g8414 [Cylindrodendrum hubeiense]|uniref:Uncharacterized protein n=1 Tax=Cylindrodendrum hubeiense TaxID=595255 RepID=A0A9P5H726_9HYPO|nr:hypothetical protein G7Z17_g8414 [Cylindrodendrum hubeiense]
MGGHLTSAHLTSLSSLYSYCDAPSAPAPHRSTALGGATRAACSTRGGSPSSRDGQRRQGAADTDADAEGKGTVLTPSANYTSYANYGQGGVVATIVLDRHGSGTPVSGSRDCDKRWVQLSLPNYHGLQDLLATGSRERQHQIYQATPDYARLRRARPRQANPQRPD